MVLEPENNPNRSFIVDPPRPIRFLMSTFMSRNASASRIAKNRAKAETERKTKRQAHRVDYFHQLDDPYSHLVAQVVADFATQYDIEIVPHLIRASGGRNQPEEEKLATWARTDCGLIAPHYGLSFPENAGRVPEPQLQKVAGQILAGLTAQEFLARIKDISTALWSADPSGHLSSATLSAKPQELETALDEGSALLATMNHYSGGTFHYGGEWYWGVDRLFHLEQRLRDLDACSNPTEPYLVSRPSHDLDGVDASGLTLEFFPSLNSPYTAIIYDRTVELVDACGITLNHKPVLPMIMRGVAATNAKGSYILFDAKREADFFNIPFGPCATPIGTPTRRSYSLLPWAKTQGKDVPLLSKLLNLVFAQGVGLHKVNNIRRAVEEVGLQWQEARQHLDQPDWKAITEQNQNEMVDGMGLWGVPSYRLSGPDGEPDLAVWGQDRLWLIAAEIRRRAAL